MYLQILVIFAVTLQMSFANLPVIFQKDNSVIATEPVKASLPRQHQFIPVHYPYYEVITNPAAVPTGSSPSKPDTLPADLLEIAATKLGIKNLDEIPSISELGELLGTSTREETIDTIRQLTATETGIDLIKAFIESSDYTDNSESQEPIAIEAEPSGPSLPTTILSETAQKDFEIIQKVLTTPKPELGFFQRASAYFSLFDLFPENKEIPISPVNKDVQEIKPKSHSSHHESRHQHYPNLQRSMVTNNLPNSFPLPIRPSSLSHAAPLSPYRSHPVREHRHLNKLKPILDDRFFN